MIVVLMGVSGSGKSTVGEHLARVLGWPFVEGDALHPPANVTKMASGHPLDDDDRAPWLAAVHRAIADCIARGESAVVACSALKSSYRARIEGSLLDVRFVLLAVPKAVLAERLAHRAHHFMPASLLPSQLATLEPPEGELVVDGTRSPDEIAREIIERLAITSSAAASTAQRAAQRGPA